ncbi:hypothetical protein [Zoogloea sp.]|uniref:hypothetical protein n=1 Tax=Zoogloea sp. TaxID=49181 RepID=UPI0035AEF6EF
MLYNALRQTNPTRWRTKLAKWHIPDRIPTGPMTLTTHDKGVSPPPDHKPTLPNGQTGATLQAPAAEDVGRALVGVARTTRHRFARLRFHHAWAIPLHALPPAHRTALLAELDAHRLPHHNQHQAPPEQQSAHQHAPHAQGSRAEFHPRSPTPAPRRLPSSGQAQGRRADVRSPCCGESGFCLPAFGFRSPAVGFQSGRNRNHSCPIGLCSCRIGFRSHGDGFYCGEIGFLAAGNGYCFR